MRPDWRIAWPELVLKVALTAAAVWVLVTAIGVRPDARGHGTHERLGLSPCGYLRATGQPCISCGMTTSFAHGVRGQWVRGFRASPAGLLLFFATVAAPAWLLHSAWTGQPVLRFLRWRRGWLILPLAIVAVFASWGYKIATWTG